MLNIKIDSFLKKKYKFFIALFTLFLFYLSNKLSIIIL